VFFAATDGSSGTELWRSDGTAAGTARVLDINPGAGSSIPSYLTNVNGTLFFQANDGSNGPELWVLSSPPAGTPDLTATLANDVGGSLATGSWTWTITLANSGTAAATFTAGQVLFSDNLPNSGLAYASVSVTGVTGVTNPGNLGVSIDASSNLVVTAVGGDVTLGATTGTFQVRFTVTPTAVGTYANPRGGAAPGSTLPGRSLRATRPITPPPTR
jgi:uncharacterized repeat protein (TIGR01451 family)